MRLLFVLTICSGNVCRSVMSEHLVRRALIDRGLVDGVDFHVASAGTETYASTARPVNLSATRELLKRGIRVLGHRSRRIDPAELAAADMIVAMEPAHLDVIEALVPGAGERTVVLDVIDPVGGEPGLVAEIAELLERHAVDLAAAV